MELALSLTKKQLRFLRVEADEVLFGGAAGGGKSYAQLYDALLYALKYPGSRQLMLRRSYPDLERSLIRAARLIFPRELYAYNASRHIGRFPGGSLLEFGYCDTEGDVTRYQGAEYDVIRFDELTHFTESMYTYLHSRLRGANPYPKRIKSTTNPGGIGHAWVKNRFIDIAPWDTLWQNERGSRLFIPSLALDNPFLMDADPGYLRRLDNLPEDQRRALKFGDWDLCEGRYFSEFERSVHVVEPFAIPAHWRRYLSLDYGLDMLAALWSAFDEAGRGYVYRELYRPGLIVSEAARAILEAMPGENLRAVLAPADLWGRSADTGRSQAEAFAAAGLPLRRVRSRGRVAGWLALKEWLHPFEEGEKRIAGLRIFPNCVNLLRTLPLLQHDPHDPQDCAVTPHELTHAPDALRYLCAGRPFGESEQAEPLETLFTLRGQESFLRFGV